MSDAISFKSLDRMVFGWSIYKLEDFDIDKAARVPMTSSQQYNLKNVKQGNIPYQISKIHKLPYQW